MRLNRRKSFIALSLVSMLTPLSAQQAGFKNDTDPNKQVTVGTATGGEVLSGSIETSGQSSKTVVRFLGSSSMESGQISATANANGQGAGGAGAINEIHLEGNSVLKLTAGNGNAANAGGGAAANTPPYSILAQNRGAQNTISDITTGTTTGSIAGAISAMNGGVNTIFNLRNHAVSGPIIANGVDSKNDIKFDAGTTFKSYIAAIGGGVNTIELNNGAKFDTGSQVEATTGASILADDNSAITGTNGGNGAQQPGTTTSSNTITGTSTDAGTIKGKILAQNRGTNTITLTGLKVDGDLEAGPGGTNTITLTNGHLTNVRTRGAGSSNTVTLNGNATIKGFITNSETVVDTEGNNTITLNDASSLDLHKNNNTDGSAIFTSKKTQNTISGNSTGSHKIDGNITAKSEGKNTITLTTLNMTGNVNADGGTNEINLGVVGNTNASNIKGNITASSGNFDRNAQTNGAGVNRATQGLNQMELLNVKVEGNIDAKSRGQNVLNLRDVDVTGDITSEDGGNNHLTLGNGGLQARIKGAIKAKSNGTNTIEFNNGYADGGVFAEGKDAKNTITLGNATYTGEVKTNITATNEGENDISIQSVNLTGSIIAEKGGKNTIDDKNPFNAPSVITGGIIAKNDGTNTATLKNITITDGITAEGQQGKNMLTLGEKQDGVITSNITAKAGGENEITFKDHLSLFGDIKAEKSGKNTVKEDGNTKTQSLVQGQILADGGENTITLANTRITNGITAKGQGAKNTITISTTDTDAALYANLTATDGGSNTATLGGNGMNNAAQSGVLEGSLSASGSGSKNELTLNNTSNLRNGFIIADASKNTGNGTTVNTITLNGTSSLALQGPVNDGVVGYAIYATGRSAKNTINDNTTNGTLNTINGFIVADNGGGQNNQNNNAPNATKAQNQITLKNLTLNGDINAYNGGDNTLKLTNATLNGNVLAQTRSTNNIEFENGAQATMNGTFAVDGGGVNTVTLNNMATFNITSNNNAQAFQATGERSKNTLREVNATANTTGSITGDIFATRMGENEIKMRALRVDGNVTAWGGTNTIELGTTNAGSLSGHIAASSTPVLEFGNMDSKNTIILNGNASLQGSIEAQGTTAEVQATNEITLNNNAGLMLRGAIITDNQGTALGTGNDAIFSETLRAYNKVDDKGSGTSIITGNIYAKNNSVDPGQVKNVNSGNDITLKKVTMTGNIIADSSGKNVINFGKDGATLVGDITAKERGTNTVVFGTGNVVTSISSSMQGNISATDTATNTLTLGDTDINERGGASYSIIAMTRNAGLTSNTLTLNGASSITNTALLAIQTATEGIANEDNSAKNTITLNDLSSLNLSANPAAQNPTAAILAQGLYANNTVMSKSTNNNTITGDIRADGQNASNTVTLNSVEMKGNVIADNNAKNTINFASTSGSLTGDIIASNHSTNSVTFGRARQIPFNSNATINGNVTASSVSSNSIVLNSTTMNAQAGRNYLILASGTEEDAGTTQNSLTLKNSNLQNTAISATQQVRIGPNASINASTPTKNELRLEENSFVNLVANAANAAIGGSDADYAGRAAVLASGLYAQNTITDATNATANSNNTITGDIVANYGAAHNTITLKRINMTGNIIADNNAKNTIKFGNGVKDSGTFYGDIAAYTRNSESKNEVNFNGVNIGGAEVRGIIATNDAQKDGGVNIITLEKESKLTNMYMKSMGIKSNNKITLKDAASSITLAADNQDGNAMYAKDEGSNNTIEVTGNINNNANHSITGNITSYDGGKNNITYSLGSTQNAQNNTKALEIKGDILSWGDGTQNNLTLEGASKLESSNVTSRDGGVNNIKFQNNGNGAGTMASSGVFTITNASDAALLANGWMATNTFENSNTTSASTISGDIISRGGGINTLEKVSYLTIKDGSIQARGDNSRNSIMVAKQSSITLKSDSAKNAVYATGFDAKNIIKDGGDSSAQNTITGNINADNGAKNEITLKNLQTTGNLIATRSGSNTITIGNGQAANTPGVGVGTGTAPSSSFAGALSASGTDAANTVTINKDVTLTLSKDDTTNNNAVYASGTNAKNTLTDSSGKKATITGDIRSERRGSNSITIGEGEFAGDVYALSGGSNTITFSKGSVAAKDPNAASVLTQKITADGANSINILNYNDTNFASGVMVADHGGENRLFLRLPGNQTGGAAGGNMMPNAADPLRLDITTGINASNKAVAEGVSAAQARVTYIGGDTVVVFSQSKTSGNNTGGDITTTAYSDGVLLTLDANSANNIFKDFRDLQSFFTNLATTYMKDKNHYSISGNYVGAINFLKESGTQSQTQSVTLDLEKDSSLLAKVYTNSTGSLTLNIKQGSKWVVTPTTAGSGVVLEKLSGDMLENKRADVKDTLRERATIIDLATGGYATKYGVFKNEHTALTLNNASGLDGTNFRVFADIINRKSDTIHVLKVDNAGGMPNAADQKNLYLQAYYTTDSLHRAMSYSYDDTNTTNNTLVASVDKGAKDRLGFNISEASTVEQGYLLVTTEFIKKEEPTTPLAGTTTGTMGKVDNYYIKGYSAKINPKEADNSYGIASVNYLVWLANTNNINKRLGEVRDTSYGHGLWVRGYGGQIMQDQGIMVTNNYISTQTGYDFGLPMENGMHIIGFTFGYGSNDLKSDAWKMRSTYLSGGMYYSYVKDSGFYSDTIGRYDYIRTTPVDISDLKSDIISSVITLSQEIGYRAYFDTKKRFFFEGQLEAVGGYMRGDAILQARSTLADAQITSKMPNSFVFRGIAGGVLGYRIKTKKNQTDLRIGASYVADYALGKMELDVGNGIAKDSRELGFNQMVIANLGVNTMLTEYLRMYFDFGMGFIGKSINQNYLANVGIRYGFGTKRRESTFGEVSIQENPDFKTLNIQAPKIKCAECNPESGFYLEVVKLPTPNANVGNYLARTNDYRVYTNENGQATYYVGPFKTLQEAKQKQPEIDKIVQGLMRNPSASAGIYKINNKAKK